MCWQSNLVGLGYYTCSSRTPKHAGRDVYGLLKEDIGNHRQPLQRKRKVKASLNLSGPVRGGDEYGTHIASYPIFG